MQCIVDSFHAVKL